MDNKLLPAEVNDINITILGLGFTEEKITSLRANSPAKYAMKTRKASRGQWRQFIVSIIGMSAARWFGFEAFQYFLEMNGKELRETVQKWMRSLRPPEKWLPRNYPSQFDGQTPRQLFPHLKRTPFFDREWVSTCPPEKRLDAITHLLKSGLTANSPLYDTLDHGVMCWSVVQSWKGLTRILKEWRGSCIVGWKDGVVFGDEVFFPVIDHCVSDIVTQCKWMEKGEILKKITENPELWPIVMMVPLKESIEAA